MVRRPICLAVAGMALAAAAASAAPPAPSASPYTALACTLGPVRGQDHTLLIRNTAGRTLKAETIINIELDWKAAPGTTAGRQDCFATDADLPAGARLSHALTLDDAVTGASCSAYLSSARPAVVHQSDGGSFTECDPK